MKSNSKQVRAKVRATVLDMVQNWDISEYNDQPDTLKNRLEIILNEWESGGNYEYEKRRTPNNHDRFRNWMQGLPSCFEPHIYDSDILETVVSWGLPQREGKPYRPDQTSDLYYYLLISEFEKLAGKEGVKIW